MQHEIHQHTLAGGARLLTIQIPNTTTYYWSSTFRAGYRFVTPELYELPHLAEHLAFEGTKTWPDSLAFKVEIERDGTYYNASTGFDFVSYMYSGSRDELERIIPINMSQIYEPLYREESVTQEQNVIVQEMSRKREDDGWRAFNIGTNAVLPERNPDIDERISRIRTSNREDLLRYHADCYGAANSDFIVAGDYSDADIRQIMTALESGLKDNPMGERKAFAKPKFIQPGGRVVTAQPMQEKQSQLWLRFMLPGRDNAHYPALRIMAALLTGGLSARLMRIAREQGLTYGIRAAASANHDTTTLSISSQTEVEKIYPLFELTLQELTRLRDDEFTEDELERAIGYTVGGVRRANQTPAHYASWYAERFLVGEAMESPEERAHRLLAVDRLAIRTAAARYLQTDHAIAMIIGKDLDGERSKFEQLLVRHFS